MQKDCLKKTLPLLSLNKFVVHFKQGLTLKKLVASLTMSTVAIATMIFTLPSVTLADVYPGDTAYSKIVQDVYGGVTSDNIMMEWKSEIRTRPQLCQELVTRHNSLKNRETLLTNAQLINTPLSVNECLNALYYSKGYTSKSGWMSWAGRHSGTWVNDDGIKFLDNATWEEPIKEPSKVGENRFYDFQKVTFDDREPSAKYGWNQSHPDVAYVWGWDPKDSSNDEGQTGTNVGFTFSKGQANCIIWVSPKEAFLECVKGDRRTSTGFFGLGQWYVTP